MMVRYLVFAGLLAFGRAIEAQRSWMDCGTLAAASSA
jgi:hypothetical protein